MLQKSKRLSRDKFNTVYNFGTNIPSEVGYFKVFPWEDQEEHTRISCVSARKDTKKAVERSRVRRRGYSAVERGEIPKKGYGIIWFLPKKTLDIKPSELDESIRNMINSLNDV